jgi:polyhydroxyalkanoate synthase
VRSFLRMGKWESDNIPFPGGVFRQMVNGFLREQPGSCEGTWTIGGRRVDLGAIRVPLLHLLRAGRPHHPLRFLTRPRAPGGQRRQDRRLVLKGGHVGLVAGRGAELRMWPALDAWLAPKSV